MPWNVIAWFLIVGGLLSVMGTIGPLLGRVWFSSSIVYLLVGYGIGPAGLDLLTINLVENAQFIEHLSEIAVIVSLYGAGMKIRLPLTGRHWVAPTILAAATMVATVAATAAIGHYALAMPIGLAVLLGAVLAPTDPVLAGDVQLDHPDDTDGLRRTLTGEAGLNDGTAFPMVLLGVGLISADYHELGTYGLRWVVVDVGYKITAGLLFGYAAGWALSHAAVWIRKRVRAELASDEMLTLGFISLVYGAALAIDTYAFLSVFAAALAMRQVELDDNHEASADEAVQEAERSDVEHEADAPEHATALLTRDNLVVADTMERLVQIVLVVMVGVLLSAEHHISLPVWAFGAAMVLLVRPATVAATLWTGTISTSQKALTAWFGVRGIGTFYYLAHALVLGVGELDLEQLQPLLDAALATITISIVLHGVTVTPMMQWYEKQITNTSHRSALRSVGETTQSASGSKPPARPRGSVG